jgi:predicted RNA binding protein YcfA (HicA-like mRNA interferase family)
MKARDLIREARRSGWSVTRTGGDHLKLTHPEASRPVFTGSTPSDCRAIRHARAEMRRQLRGISAPGGRRS